MAAPRWWSDKSHADYHAQCLVPLALAILAAGRPVVLSPPPPGGHTLTMVTEHTGKAAAGQMRGSKATTSAAGAKKRREHDNDMMKYLACVAQLASGPCAGYDGARCLALPAGDACC